jgi:hypothetical protein
MWARFNGLDKYPDGILTRLSWIFMFITAPNFSVNSTKIGLCGFISHTNIHIWLFCVEF